MSFDIILLGTPSVVSGAGVPVTGPAVQRHRLALLALLSLDGGRGATRDRLVADLWPESTAAQARQLLNQAVYQLRKALGEVAILSAGDDLLLNLERLSVDSIDYERLLAGGDPQAAVTLYHGPFLDGFFVGGAPGFEQRVDQERQRLGELHARALEALAEAAERAGDLPGSIAWWRARSAHDPFDSRAALRLMQALDAAGNRAGALQHAAQHTLLLQEEFGIAPAPALSEWVERVRAEPLRHVGDRARTHEAIPLTGPNSATAPMPPGASSGVIVAQPPLEPVEPPATLPSAAGALPSGERAVRRSYWAPIAAALVIGVAGYVFAASRGDDTQWLLREALPRIEAHLAVADWESAFEVAREAERRKPASPEVAELWPRVSWSVTLESEPAGATVFRQAYGAPDDDWEELGRTPLRDIRIPYGLSRLRFELEGHTPLIRAIGGGHLNWHELKPSDPDHLLVGPELFRLDRAASLPPDLVRVSGGSAHPEDGTVEMKDFFLGRYEITNAEYRAFVAAGGYRRPELWDPVVRWGVALPWDEAMQLFVDRTGRPGPSTWEGGDHPRGEAEYPVSGLSWYEAAAYARWAGRELPTAHHWQHALAIAMFPWLLPASNFGDDGPRSVRTSRALSHVGAYDMTGNVREWTSTRLGDEAIILGGSWNDPYYIAGTTDTSAPLLDRSAGNGLRVAITHDDAEAAARLRAPLTKRATAPDDVFREPVPDALYAAYSRVFDYDRRPLDDHVESTDTTRVWIRERITFAGAYGSERMTLHLYLPRGGHAPYQTVLYWPGWDTFALNDVDEYFAKQVDFLVTDGRAVAFPILEGIFERGTPGTRRRPEFGTAEYRDNTIHTVKDLRRTVDYLETRPDIDRKGFALFGYSWGGVNGPVALAQEPRIRVAVIKIGLLPPMRATPEADPLHALPRVRVPTLLFSGEFDPMVPLPNARRYFELLGTPAADKRHVLAIGGHFIPRQLVIRETLDWLDRYLGPAGH